MSADSPKNGGEEWDRHFSRRNARRCSEAFRHSPEDWPLQNWALAIAGEAGELANVVKKRLRGDEVLDEQILDEVADVVTYCDLLCTHMGVRLRDVVDAKFDDVSRRVGWSEDG